MTSRNINIVISSLAAGGAEKIASLLANHFVSKGFVIQILTLDNGEEKPFYELNSSVVIQPLSIAGLHSSSFSKLQAFLHRLNALRQTIKSSDPDTVISFMDQTNVMTAIALIGTKIPLIVAERSDPFLRPASTLWRFLRQCSYPFANAIVVQTAHAKSFFSPRLRRRTHVIANPVPAPIRFADLPPVETVKRLATVARLEPYKGIDLLIRAFHRIAADFLDWNLEIIGDGPERENLKLLTKTLNLTARIQFSGRLENPERHLRRASLFVLASDFEGFPNALCEAMALGIAPIATSTTGASSIIRDGVDGVLVPIGDEKALSEAIQMLMANPSRRADLGRAAREITERFNLDHVLEDWEKLLESTYE